MRRFEKFLALLILVGCAASEVTTPQIARAFRPDIIATNAFYYYDDVDAAWAFYRDTLGFETVVDYGFAKIVRIAESSYLTLVRATEGMHSADEPKTVTLNLVTDELSRWDEHLTANAVPMRVAYREFDGQATNSFVAVDPEGYLLKFSRYNPHPNHATYVAGFAAAKPILSKVRTSTGNLSIRASAFSAYFTDPERVRSFYESLFDVAPAGQMESVDIYQLSSSGFLLLADGSDGLHQPTEKSGVTFSFLTSDIDGWYDRAANWSGFELRTPEILNEDGLVRVFVGYDPVGTFLEWDTFQDVPENAALSVYLP